MRTNSTTVALLFGLASTVCAGDALARCSANPPYATTVYDVAAEPAKLLRGTDVIREFTDASPYATSHPNTVTRLVPTSPGDCQAQMMFPSCSELEIEPDGNGNLAMALKDATFLPSTDVFRALPLHASGAKVDYLVSDRHSVDGKDYVFFVYLKNEPIAEGVMAKNYLVEAFDVADARCEMYRPDLHPELVTDAGLAAAVAKKTSNTAWARTSKTAAKATARCETAATNGHEGKP